MTAVDLAADPQVWARGMVMQMPHEQAQDLPVKMVANPVKLSATPAADRITPPALGEHTVALLGAVLGMDAAEIAALREKG